MKRIRITLCDWRVLATRSLGGVAAIGSRVSLASLTSRRPENWLQVHSATQSNVLTAETDVESATVADVLTLSRVLTDGAQRCLRSCLRAK